MGWTVHYKVARWEESDPERLRRYRGGMRKATGNDDKGDENGGSRRKGAAEDRESSELNGTQPAGIPRRAGFLCLWANLWSKSVWPQQAS